MSLHAYRLRRERPSSEPSGAGVPEATRLRQGNRAQRRSAKKPRKRFRELDELHLVELRAVHPVEVGNADVGEKAQRVEAPKLQDTSSALQVIDFTRAVHRTPSKRKGRLEGVTLHYAAGGNGDITKIVQALRKHKADYNYLIDAQGRVYMLVRPDRVAWHAGGSKSVRGREINNATVGIAFINGGWSPFKQAGWKKLGPPPVKTQEKAAKWNNDARFKGLSHAWWAPYPAVQVEAGSKLVAWLFRTFDIEKTGGFWTHGGQADWKADPGPAFPLQLFVNQVRARLSLPPVTITDGSSDSSGFPWVLSLLAGAAVAGAGMAWASAR